MQKLKEKQKKFIGIVPKESKINNKGITLIALIITIIVMLILVGVTINIALNGGLFEKTRTAAKQTEEQVIYEQIFSAMNIGENGKNLVKETYSTAKSTLEGQGKTVNLVRPSSETDIIDSAVFEVEGNNGEYIYTITENEIIIGEEEEKVYSFTLKELGTWSEDIGDSRIVFNINNVWEVVGENLINNSKYSLVVDEYVTLFSIETDNNLFGNLLVDRSSVEDEVQFLVAAEIFEGNWNFIVFDRDGWELLGNGQITHQEFMNTYGDVVFRFADVSSINMESL